MAALYDDPCGHRYVAVHDPDPRADEPPRSMGADRQVYERMTHR